MATVAVVKAHYSQRFACDTGLWSQRTQLSQPIQTDDTSATALLPDGALFVSGGNAVSDCWPCAYRIGLDGEVTRLANLIRPRGHHGVIVFAGAVFIFGGRYYGELLNDSEKLELHAEQPQQAWRKLSDMPTERAFFQPCSSASLIFLCGGGSNTVESYDPATDQYAQLPFLLPESTRNHIAAWVDNSLFVVSQTSVTRWTGERDTKKHETWPDVWGNFAVTVSGSAVYTVRGDAVLKVDLSTTQQFRILP